MQSGWFVSVILFLTVACSGYKTPAGLELQTDIPFGAATPLGQTTTAPDQPIESNATHTPLLQETATQEALPEATTAVFLERAAIIARVSGGSDSFFLLGGVAAGNWVSADDIEITFAAAQEYNLYSAFEFTAKLSAKRIEYEPICDDNFVSFTPLASQQSVLGISASWDVLPRAVQMLPSDTEVYLHAVATWLVAQAPSQPVVVIDKIWKVDLDGDGADEVFINANHFVEASGHNVAPGDYSLILMRTVIGNEVVTLSLVGDYYTEHVTNEFPLSYQLEFIGDLNGDGRMEVVVGVTRWEGSGVMVFEIEGAQVRLVLAVMCSL